MQTAKKVYETQACLERQDQEKMILDQLGEVRFIARRIHDRLPRHVELDDLVHSGVLGLIDAVHKFDPGKNVQFKSYAKFRIRGAILDSLRELDWSPRDLRKKARRLEEAERNLRNKLGRSASEQELAQEMDCSLEEFQQLLGELRGLDLGSLQDPRGNDGEDTILGNLKDSDPPNDPFAMTLQSEMRDLLARAIGELPERERRILSLYYFEELTMKEVGAILGLTESRICQIHSAALVRLRSRLADFLDSNNFHEQNGVTLEALIASAVADR